MKRNFQFDPFQKQAIEYCRQGNSVIVSAPTGAGKTLIAEHVIEDCLRKNKGVIYTAPIKALSNQKFRDFSRKYPGSSGILTGDVGLNTSAPILIMTTEIFRNTLLTDPERLAHREWVIFDEIHYLDDIERGTVWEESIILLPPHMKMLALSATIPNLKEFIAWMSSIHSLPVKSVVEKTRPVPLHLFFQCRNRVFPDMKAMASSGAFRKQTRAGNEPAKPYQIKSNKLSPLLYQLKQENSLPCIYFSFSRRRCEKLASQVTDIDFLKKEEKDLIKSTFRMLVRQFDIENDPRVEEIKPFISKGIAYHHAGLLPTLKEIIERLFTTGLIKLIFTTETFALGVNMPARTCIFDTLSKYYGRTYHPLKTRDFFQMAGRAGRRGLDKEGFVFLRIDPRHIDLPTIDRIINGNYEPIVSQLRSSYATVLNLYKLMGEKLLDFYPLSFHFFQSNPQEKRQARSLIKRKISLLKAMGYIDRETLSEKAELASQVYSFELQVGEMYDQGFFDMLDEPTLFSLILSLVYEPRKGMPRPVLTKGTKKLKKKTFNFLRDIYKQERRFRIYPLSKKFYFHLSEAGRAWYEGSDFYHLDRYVQIDEGELVRYFRIAIQVMREMKASPAISDPLKKKLSLCMSRVNRDVVDAEKQLRQDF